ncbi:MAG: hypothetical protein IPM37_19380 [Hahellaceae bacterium]|jgi:hypothetical protein|nr:hypothetical protein [Hahellaceae bacterium]
MPKFEIESILPLEAETLATDLLCMSGVNDELAPFIRMTTPKSWNSKPISEWPIGKELFSSVILVCGLIPIDMHHFKFQKVGKDGFQESSRSLVNRVWAHERTIVACGPDAKVRDTVFFESRLGWLGHLLTPVYRWIFARRHKRLKAKYA